MASTVTLDMAVQRRAQLASYRPLESRFIADRAAVCAAYEPLLPFAVTSETEATECVDARTGASLYFEVRDDDGSMFRFAATELVVG